MRSGTRYAGTLLPRNWPTAIACACLSWAVLFASMQAGLRAPREESLAPLASLRALEYTRGDAGGFPSLREEFLAGILPWPSARSAAAGAADLQAAFAPANGGPGPATEVARVPPGPPAHTVVEVSGNDDFADGYEIARIPFRGPTDTRTASRQPGEPASCDPFGDSVWYRYRPSSDVALFAHTYGTEHATALAVFTGSGLGGLTQVGCHVSPDGNAQVDFRARAGHTYHFQVTEPAGGGRVVFNLAPLGVTERVSSTPDGRRPDGLSAFASVSADGRFVAFYSSAETLVANHRHCRQRFGCFDVFVRDRRTGRTELVSVASDGTQTGGAGASDYQMTSSYPQISADGRYVAFWSNDPNLVADDHNDAFDMFLHDRLTRRTERVSVSSAEAEGTRPAAWRAGCGAVDDRLENGPGWGRECWVHGYARSAGVSISGDGRYVVFMSELEGLANDVSACTAVGASDHGTSTADKHSGVTVPVDPGWRGCRHIYVRDRRAGTTVLASSSTAGEPAEGDSSSPYVSPNGRWVAFASDASNLAPVVAADGSRRPDSNHRRDVFVRDLRTGSVELVSLDSAERQGDDDSGGSSERGHATISDDGRWVAFVSEAANLVRPDVNANTDVFLRDRKLGTTIMVSVVTDPAPGPHPAVGYSANHSHISGNGRYIAFLMRLAADRPVGIYVYDREHGTPLKVSVTTSGDEANAGSYEPEITPDGRFVVFDSEATNLDPRDTRDTDVERDPVRDVYIHEMPWTRP